jgi:CBS-domain-containing membrane protein
LQDLDIFLDVSEEDLNMVYNRAGMVASKREMGQITCGDIMSRDLVTSEFATELEEVWAQLRHHRVKNHTYYQPRPPGHRRGQPGGFSQARQPQYLRNFPG